jgi:hypothetical protein
VGGDDRIVPATSASDGGAHKSTSMRQSTIDDGRTTAQSTVGFELRCNDDAKEHAIERFHDM